MIGLETFAQPVWRHLVFALLHTIWQGAVLALLLSLALRRLPARRQDARYLLALGAEFGVLLAALTTWAVLDYDPPRPSPSPSAGTRFEPTPEPLVRGEPAIAVGRAVAQPSSPADGSRWVPLAAIGWLAGVALMLARTAGSVVSALRMAWGPRVNDRAILDVVEQLCRDLKIGGRVRVVAPLGCTGPAVLGLVWPTLLLPVALMTGLPPESLRAILAHELAHIRRFDYALNLAQLLVEALLFFNPSVWWLGRQARLEREACCDALAVRLSGRPIEYSRTLADWADRARASGLDRSRSLVQCWTGEGPPSSLLERVRRVLRPGERPAPRVSWLGLVALLLLGPLALVALRQGTTVAVALAAQVLSPAVRLEKLEQAQARFAAPVSADRGKVSLRGVVLGPDGKPFEKDVAASSLSFSRSGGASSFGTAGPLKGAFSLDVPGDVIWIYLEPEDYAPRMVGPFEAKESGIVSGIVITLEPGFPARIRVVDEQGAPVAGARVKGGLTVNGGTCYSGVGQVTGEDGIATIPHASRGVYSMSAQAPGFQIPDSREVRLTPDTTLTMTLNHARPARGVVVAPDGSPIAGATIRAFSRRKTQRSSQYGMSGPLLATTDAAGQFTLDSLDDDATYTILVETKSQGRRLEHGIRAGQEALTWTIGPDLSLLGTVTGDLSTLEQVGGKPVVRITQYVRLEGRSESVDDSPYNTTVPVEAEENGGTFRIAGLLPGEVLIRAGTQAVPVPVDRPGVVATIDLSRRSAQPTNRRVILTMVTPDGTVHPRGALRVQSTGRGERLPSIDRRVILDKGEAEFEADAPSRVSYSPSDVIGYWFNDGSLEVEVGKEPLRVAIPAVPAGAIVGQVLGPDGVPIVEGVSLGCRVIEQPPGDLARTFHGMVNVQVDAEGRFFLSPLPLGGTYVVVAGKGHNQQVSAPIRLDGSKATVQAVLRLDPPVAAEGRVMSPDGRPLKGVPVILQLDHPQAGTGWGPPSPTDPQGRFRFDDLSPVLGEYGALLNFRRDYQPIKARLDRGGPPVEIRVERGHVLEGRIVDAATGGPIPDVELYARPADYQGGDIFGYEAEGKTDEQGRFRFSNLPARRMVIGDRSNLRRDPQDSSRAYLPDSSVPIVIRAKPPDRNQARP